MTTCATRPSVDEVWAWLAQVPDPEIPAVSVVDLGIVREARWEGDELVVAITPTYSGCPATSVIGLDIESAGVAHARAQAEQRGLGNLAEFRVADCGGRLPFRDGSFGAVLCIDAIIHLPDRPGTLQEWRRLLRPGGRLLFTDAVVVTGDSVSMLSEALMTPGPVLIADPGGLGPRHRALHEGLIAAGQARRLEEAGPSFTRTPLDETARVAAEVARRFPG